MLYHGHFTHPELWMMWYAVVGTAMNMLAVIYLILKRRNN